ncbi:unnamed protein product [[Actinomadura] parvosata subsp. kistnae]|nr:WXG100 family type VII secretion target [Nonomuraea sp. ATCC 55076]SPL95203.1 unnamed protein product [Actinomadura parvosata subsp. kistnae]
MPAEDMFDVTKLNYSGLDAGEADFQNAFNGMVETLETLEQQLLAKSAIWQGDAKAVFDEVRKIWQTEASHMSTVITELKTTINVTHMNMREVERINSIMLGAD